MKDLKKIHRVFGHPRADKLDSPMKDSGQEDPAISRMLHQIQDTCRICLKYKKKKPKPKVGLPKAREVNEVVSVDLKPVESIRNKCDDRQIVYMVDKLSRFTAAGISKNKEAENVMKVILDKWCDTGVGHPSKALFADNGNEFKGRHLEELCKRLNIRMKLTPSYSAWSNGICERRHGAIDLTVKKMLEEDKDLDIAEALKKAVWARNIAIGRHGYSPYQIIYGRSPTIPGILDGNVITDGKITSSEVV